MGNGVAENIFSSEKNYFLRKKIHGAELILGPDTPVKVQKIPVLGQKLWRIGVFFAVIPQLFLQHLGHPPWFENFRFLENFEITTPLYSPEKHG